MDENSAEQKWVYFSNINILPKENQSPNGRLKKMTGSVVLTSVFMLRALRQVFPGPEMEEDNLAYKPPETAGLASGHPLSASASLGPPESRTCVPQGQGRNGLK